MNNEQLFRAFLAGLRAFTGAVEYALDTTGANTRDRVEPLPAPLTARAPARRRPGLRVAPELAAGPPVSEAAAKRADQALRRNGIVP